MICEVCGANIKERTYEHSQKRKHLRKLIKLMKKKEDDVPMKKKKYDFSPVNIHKFTYEPLFTKDYEMLNIDSKLTNKILKATTPPLVNVR